MVIRVIVYTKKGEDGLVNVKGILDRLCGEDRFFDYYTTFDNDTSRMSGKARWGNLPAISKVDSKEGKKLIDEGMEKTKRDFLEGLKIVRRVLKKKTDINIFKSRYDKDMVKHRFWKLGQYEGDCVWVYDNDGSGIREFKHLKNVLNKWECLYEKRKKENPYKGMDIWVVPVDVHY